MVQRASVRRLLLGLVMSFALAGVGMTLPVIPGAVQLARAQISAEFREALAPYGHWERHPRWGAIWLPDDVPPDWRPYEYGHWVYTDEWGWYWISDPEEEDWGWVNGRRPGSIGAMATAMSAGRQCRRKRSSTNMTTTRFTGCSSRPAT
jgi:hypothetical protein